MSFGIVDSLAVNIILGTTYIDKCIKAISTIARRVWPVHSDALAVLASRPTSPLIVTPISKVAGPTTTKDAEKSHKAQMDAHTEYIVLVFKAKSIPAQSVAHVRAMIAMSGLVTVDSMLRFGGRRCCTLIPCRIDVKQRSPFTIVVTDSANQLVFFQELMRVAIIADTPACVVHLRGPSITAEEEASFVAEVAIADHVSSVDNDDMDYMQRRMMIPRNGPSEKRSKSLNSSVAATKILDNDD